MAVIRAAGIKNARESADRLIARAFGLSIDRMVSFGAIASYSDASEPLWFEMFRASGCPAIDNADWVRDFLRENSFSIDRIIREQASRQPPDIGLPIVCRRHKRCR